MGDYVLTKVVGLRNPFEEEDEVKRRESTIFGNPYRQDKKVSIDEQDEAATAEAFTFGSNPENYDDDTSSMMSGSSNRSNASTRSLGPFTPVRKSKSGSMRMARARSTSPSVLLENSPAQSVLLRIPKLSSHPLMKRIHDNKGEYFEKFMRLLEERDATLSPNIEPSPQLPSPRQENMFSSSEELLENIISDERLEEEEESRKKPRLDDGSNNEENRGSQSPEVAMSYTEQFSSENEARLKLSRIFQASNRGIFFC